MTELSTPRQAPRFAPRRSATRDTIDDQVRRLDWVLQTAVLGMIIMGALLVWAATKDAETRQGGDPNSYLKHSILNAGIGLVLGALTARIDYRALRAYAPILYVASIAGLFLVLVPHIGVTINGAHSWISLPAGFELQPSEFAKVALIVGMAMILAERRDGESGPRDKDVLIVLALAAVPMGLILLQPDFGSMMVFTFIVLGIISISGAPARWTVGLILGGILFGAAILGFHLLKPYQEARLTNFASQSANTGTTGYNVAQAKTAIGDGGVLGQGLFDGTQTNGGYVPEQQTDFVFSVSGEELGFAGSALLLLLLLTVLWRGTRIAMRADDPFGQLVAVGIVSWFAFQSFINIGMTLGIMPVTGLPLIFVSYGGSSMFANMIGIGLLQNVHLRSSERL
jgi:rod shape determining protein RodA